MDSDPGILRQFCSAMSELGADCRGTLAPHFHTLTCV
uniref:Uncharacterized protein n=1 Tax=Tetraselmis sp. GSL018 TaxID=582737 RepID=A0A061RGH4_9CHLO